MGAATGDVDGDGWIDLYLTAFGTNQLYRNNGDGSFSDITATAGADYVEKDWPEAHVDGNLVTAPAWPAHPKWLGAFLKLLGTEIKP